MWNYVDSSNPTLGNTLFDAVKLTKNAVNDKYKFLGYGVGFDMKGTFGFPSIGFIFGADMSPSPHIDNKKKKILILGKLCSINLAVRNKKFCLNLLYNGANSYLSGKIYLGNISKEFSANNMKKTGFYGYV